MDPKSILNDFTDDAGDMAPKLWFCYCWPPLRLRSMVTAAAVAGSALPLGSDGPGGWWCCLPTTRMCIWCQQRQAGRQPKTEQDNVITDVNPIDWFHLCIILCHRLLLMPNYIQQRMWWQKQGQFGMILLARHPPASQPATTPRI